LVNEVTDVRQATDATGATVTQRRPNPAGIKAVLFRFAKNLKESLD
jgi:hypothetical protein